MSKGFAKVTILGNLGADPETRSMPNGDPVTSISVAATEHYTDKSGVKQEATEWVRVTFFRKLAEIAGKYLKQGSQVYIEGKMKTRKYAKDGVTHYRTEVIASELTMVGGRPGDDPTRHASGNKAPENPTYSPNTPPEDFDDNIPF